MQKPKLHLDVIVDVVCPWCFLGKRRLDAAIADLDDLDIEVRYRPFQLDPTIPGEGIDREEYIIGKFGSADALDEAHARLFGLGADVGITYAFDLIEKTPNTLDAHRLVRWAAAEGLGDPMLERLFSLFFEEGADLTNAETLVAAAEEVGLDGDEVTMKLEDGVDLDAVKADIAHAGRIGITGVPTVIVENRFAISGAQTSEVLVDALRRIAAELDATEG
ncbi:DSBA oxidoreductase [uncultured Pleomorphomonas sp.]|uniref:DSBA oxidoreductase n=1 Tax=uncultured Pleomorphomonas sp. TaxID=442121 RepID=A0A212L928_9HYPH|nr:DsbA family oxidoreductase [uncultured Pleomorphomonas sp.]SCM74072.1 DSBA oxidoreductase [uncultured Pleomorphomonas sp.]